YFQSLVIGSKIEVTKVSDYNFHKREIDQQANGLLQSLEYEARYSRMLKMSKRDINSKWGQYVDVRYRHTPLGGDYHGNIFHVQSILYNPGLFKHHSFFLKGSYQHQQLASGYHFSSNVIYPR